MLISVPLRSSRGQNRCWAVHDWPQPPDTHVFKDAILRRSLESPTAWRVFWSPPALDYLVGLTCLMHIVPMAVLIAFRQQVLGFIVQGLPWMEVILFVVIYLPLSALSYENSHHHFSITKQSTIHSIDPILSIPQWASLEATMKTTHLSLVLLIH